MVQGVFASIRLDRLARRAAVAAAALVAVPALAAAQTTVTLNAPKTEINCDVTIQGGGYASVNFQSSDGLALKNSDANYTRRVLLKFDTQNTIPAGTKITSAKLYMVLKNAADNSTRPITAYRVSKSFHIDQATWLRYDKSHQWAKAGGDLADKYTTTNIGNAEGNTYTFDLTEAVQDSINGKFGSRYTRLALVDTGSKTSGSYREFYSSRAADASLRPKLVITYGGGGGSSEPASAAPPPSGTGATLKVMTWNVHKTTGTDGKCSPDRTASWIVKLGADVVALNEVGYFSGACSYTQDMGAVLEGLVEQKSGKAWYRRFANHGGNGPGALVMSRFPFSSSSAHALPYTNGVAQATIVVNGRNVNVFSGHVEYDNAAHRTAQTTDTKNWAASFSEPRIVMGDFNTWPNTSDYNILASVYYDAWVKAQQAGTATAYKSGGTTHGASRFDYVYYSKNGTLNLKSVSVPNTSSGGVYPSDHDPVIAVFDVQ